MATAPFDPVLIEAARNGDRVALDALLRAALPHIRRHAQRRCIAQADDATQEALWAVYRKTPTLRSVAAFPAWLVRIVARICLGLAGPLWRRIEALKEAGAKFEAHPDGYRDAAELVAGLKRVAPFDISVACYPECHPDAASAAETLPIELRIDLARAVDSLPEIYRAVLHRHYYEELPLVEIAARLGISTGAAKVRLHRGREAIRRRLAGQADGHPAGESA